MMSTAYIFGTGKDATNVYEKYKDKYNISGFLDNDPQKWGSLFCGMPVFQPQAKYAAADVIIIGSNLYKGEMEIQLRNDLGLSHEKIITPSFVNVSDYIQTPPGISVSLGSGKCINRCSICPQQFGRAHEQLLDIKVLEKAIIEIPNATPDVTLTAYYEPLLVPNLLECVKIVSDRKPGAKMTINTAGILFDETLFKKLLPYLSGIKVSLNAVTADDFSYLTGGIPDNFDKAIGNIFRLKELSMKIAPKLDVVLQILKLKKVNYEQLHSFLAPFRKKGIRVHYCDVYNWGGIADTGKIIETRLRESDFVPMLQTNKRRYPCLALFSSIQLYEDGFYYPCPPAKRSGSKFDGLPIGDARKMHFKEAYDVLRTYQNRHLAGDYDCLDCSTCDGWAIHSKEIFSDYISDDNAHQIES